MIADVKFMKEKFSSFNKLIFSSSLPAPYFKVREARSYRGKFIHDRSPLYGDIYTIILSKSFNLEERELEDVMIHEMIHLHIAYSRINDSSSHGPQFRALMHRINSAYGRNIQISHRMSAESSGSVYVQKDKRSYICVMESRDGEKMIARVPSTKIFEFHRIFSANPLIVSETWYGSLHPAFQFFPASRTPKAYKMTPEAEEALSSRKTIEMVFKGRYFQPKSTVS